MKKIKILYVIQICIVLGLGAFIFHMVREDYAADVDSDMTSSVMLSDCLGLSELETGNAQNIKKNMGINPADYDWVLYYYGGGVMNVSELLIVKTDDADAMETAVSGAENRLNTQITNFTNYGTDQILLLDNAVKRRIGDYYFFCISDNAEQWEEVFLGLVR